MTVLHSQSTSRTREPSWPYPRDARPARKKGTRRSHHHVTPVQIQYCARCNEPVCRTASARTAATTRAATRSSMEDEEAEGSKPCGSRSTRWAATTAPARSWPGRSCAVAADPGPHRRPRRRPGPDRAAARRRRRPGRPHRDRPRHAGRRHEGEAGRGAAHEARQLHHPLLAAAGREARWTASSSAGNTGAVVAGGLMTRKFLKGVHRPGIATVMPTAKGRCVILDVGANVIPKPQHLFQYGVMGARLRQAHPRHATSPTIGLMNVGEEEGKGHDLVQKTHDLLPQQPAQGPLHRQHRGPRHPPRRGRRRRHRRLHRQRGPEGQRGRLRVRHEDGRARR